MNTRNLTYMTIASILCIGILLLLNAANLFQSPLTSEHIQRKFVRGMAISHHGKLYTLNFEQQNAVIDFLNHSTITNKDTYTPQSLNFDKIVIYQFDKPDLEVIPIAYDGNSLIFYVPDWDTKNYLKDNSNGKFKSLIATTYDE